VDELYVVARRVLLDALEALGPHREALVVVGAQAIYLRAGEADLVVAPYTTDGDLALDPDLLAEIPPLEAALVEADFVPGGRDAVGVWLARRGTRSLPEVQVQVDLLVPEAVSPVKGRRAARLRGHEPTAARIVRGLEGVLVDQDRLALRALDPGDARVIEAKVAGPAGCWSRSSTRSRSARGRPAPTTRTRWTCSACSAARPPTTTPRGCGASWRTRAARRRGVEAWRCSPRRSAAAARARRWPLALSPT
jgi:hypothetical protein